MSAARRFRAFCVVLLLITLLPVPPSGAGESPNGDVAVAWPGVFGEYTMADGALIIDVQDNNPGYSDIWGGPGDTLGSTFFESDGTNIFVRLRVREDPSSKNGGFSSTVFMVSIAAGGVQQAVVGLNGKDAKTDYVYAASLDGSTVRQVYTTPFTNDGSGTSEGARSLAAADGGYFIDFQLPIAAITAVAPSITPSTPVQLFFGTSQAANLSVINKDFMIGTEVSYVGLSTVTLSGAPAGSPPDAVDDAAAVPQDGSIVVDVAANDSDPDGDLDPSTVVVTSVPVSGVATANGDGTVTYTPDTGFAGSDSVLYEVCDSIGLCSTATVTVTVEAAGSPPTASADIAVTAEDGSVLIDATANDSDPDGDLEPTTAVVSTAPLNGAATANGDGTFTYIPDPDFFGSDAFDYTVCDGGGRCDTSEVTVTVDPVLDAPLAAGDTATVLEDGSVVVDVVANDSDADGDLVPTTVTISTPAADGTVTANGDGTVTYTPAPDFSGSDSFTYTVCDTTGLCDSASVDVTVDPVNDPPVAGGDTVVLPEDTPTSFSVLDNDADVDGDLLSLTAHDLVSAAGGGVACDGGGLCTYTPPADFSGSDTFTYTIDDGNGGTSVATVDLTVIGVNDPPGIIDDSPGTIEDAPVIVTVLANDSDPDGDGLNIDFFTQPANGSVTDNGDGTLTYAPDSDFSGGDVFTYRACDDGTPSLCGEATVTVSVTPMNDAPVASDDATATDEDVPVTFDILANDGDVDGDTLTVSAYDSTSSDGGTVLCTPAGSCTYTPPALYSGTDSFSYTSADGNGGFDTATATIAVAPVNNRPVAGDDTAGATEDMVAVLTSGSLLGNDSDPDGPLPLAITAVTDGANGTASIVAGDVVYTPNPDYYGMDTLTYTVCDGGGLCDTAAISITVASENDPPVAKDDTATTDEDVPVTVAVLGNDADTDGDALTVTAIATPPVNGTAVINGDNTITYTPAADYFGTDDFEYQISDGNGGLATAWARFVTVNPVNDAPVAGSDAATVDEDNPVTIAVLANDTDVDDATLSVTDAGPAANGSVTINGDGTIDYTPEADFHGLDSFTYTVCDAGGLCATETVDVTVDPVNDAPVASPDSVITGEDGSAVVAVIGNDGDVDGDSLTVSAATSPLNGTVTLNGDGSVTYAPLPNYSGADSFDYTVCDPAGACDSATVTVTVAPQNDAPVAADDPALVGEDSTAVIAPTANDVDVDGDPLTVTFVASPSNGDAAIEADGTVSYAPDPDFFGTDSFSYIVSDGTVSAGATVLVTVEPVNDPPVVLGEAPTTDEDSPLVIDVLANDSDIDGDALVVAAVSPPANGTVTNNGDGTITYVPDADFFGTDTFTYLVGDGTDTVAGTVEVTVAPINDSPSVPAALAVSAAPGDVPPPITLDDPEGDAVTVSVIAGSLPTGLVLNSDGTWSGEAGEDGNFEVTLEVCDGATTPACTVMVLSLSISLLPATGVSVGHLMWIALLLLISGLVLVQAARSQVIEAVPERRRFRRRG